jgi:hypothetical protein
MDKTEQKLQATIIHGEGQSLVQSLGRLVTVVKQGPIFSFVQLPTGDVRGCLNEYLTVYR